MKTKILFLLPSFRKGGEAKNTLNILNALDGDRFDLTLLICSKGNDDLKGLLTTKVELIELQDYSGDVRAFLEIFRAIRRVSPDITFTSFIDLNYFVGIYKRIFNRKMISILRFNTLPSNKLNNGSFFNITEERLLYSLSSADKIIAQTTEMRNEVIGRFPATTDRVEVISNAINRKQIRQLAQDYRPFDDYRGTTLVAVGSLWEVKGFDYLIKAVAKLVHEHEEAIRLFIVGENMTSGSGYDRYLSGLIHDLRLAEHVFLVGYTSNPYPYMKHADVFVLPSLKEGFPNVVLEALCLEVPCVVSDCIDFSDVIVAGSNGYVVPKADANALADGIIKAKNISFQTRETSEFDYNEWFGAL